MEQSPEIKQQRGSLLDKFIRNEKKAKLWAALSLLAFCATASTVLVLAYQIKGKGNVPVAEIIKDQKDSTTKQTDVKPEPVAEIPDKKEPDKKEPAKEDPQLKKYIAGLEDRIKGLEDELRKNKEQNALLSAQAADLRKQLADCKQAKPPASTPPTTASNVSVMIYIVNAANRMADSSVEKLKKFIRANSKNGLTVDNRETRNANNPCIIYYEDKFADQANYIARILSVSKAFNPMLRLKVIHDVTNKGAANIEIWPGYFR